jgi:hypothetical protein
MKTVFVSGAIANKCRNGGETWVRLNWVLAFRKLGYRVCFVEQIDRSTCVDSSGAVAPFEESVNLSYFKQVIERFGLSDSAALIYADGEQVYGIPQADLLDLADSADLLVNITGHLAWQPLLRRIRHKVYIDIDPGFTQFWHVDGDSNMRLAGHDHYFTIAENIGSPSCNIPLGDIPWRRTRQPVVLDEWPVSHDGDPNRFTTIASWRGGYGQVKYCNKIFGLKVHEFRKILRLPQRVPVTFEIALDIHPGDDKDLNALRENGWQIVNPSVVAGNPLAFRRYIQASGAEFSVAQGIYVETNSGWFSDRTTRYLASGKPALVQDTGFGRNIPVGEGLFAFRTMDEAIAGVEAITRDYEKHCRAARKLAEEYFDSDKVLTRFIEEVGITP